MEPYDSFNEGYEYYKEVKDNLNKYKNLYSHFEPVNIIGEKEFYNSLMHVRNSIYETIYQKPDYNKKFLKELEELSEAINKVKKYL